MYPSRKRFRRNAAISLLILCCLAFVPVAHANEQSRDQVELLTQSMVALGAEHRLSGTANRQAARERLVNAASDRRELVDHLMKTDPGAVLRVAVPAKVRSSMPIEVRNQIEQHVVLEGQWVSSYQDFSDGTFRLLHEIRGENGTVNLNFKGDAPRLEPGSMVRAEGVRLDGNMALLPEKVQPLMLAADGGTSGGTNSGVESVIDQTPGEQPTLVLMINFQDKPWEQPWTETEIFDTVFVNSNDFFLENSSGTVWLSGEVRGWYTIPIDSSGCDMNAMIAAGNQAAADDGVTVGNYQRIVYFHPSNGCGWSGVASVGGDPSTALINGTTDNRVVTHEIGHTLGLHHAHGKDCGAVTLADNCQNVEYGDSLDVMGSRTAHFNAFHKERIGWLDASDIQTVESTGQYVLSPYAESGSIDPKAIKVLKDADPLSGKRTWYYVEYRQAVGYDSVIIDDPAYNSENILNGLIVRTATEGDGQSSNMLDMTPNSDIIFDWFDSALEVGQTYTDATAGLSITTAWADGTSAGVLIDLEDPAPICTRADPVLDVTPGESDWVPAGTAVEYSVRVTNRDSEDCGRSTFELSVSGPQGWALDFDVSGLTLDSGSSGTTVLTVQSSTSAADGFYDLDVLASNAGDAGLFAESSATYVVDNPVEAPANHVPDAVDDQVSLLSKTPVDIGVLGNDRDPDGDHLSIIGFSDGAKGSVSLNADGTLRYTPGKRFKSTDSFSYRVSDGELSDSATVRISLQEESSSGGGKPGGGKGKSGK